jgi:hypothetical protein
MPDDSGCRGSTFGDTRAGSALEESNERSHTLAAVVADGGGCEFVLLAADVGRERTAREVLFEDG